MWAAVAVWQTLYPCVCPLMRGPEPLYNIYITPVSVCTGMWVNALGCPRGTGWGVQFDEPVGKNDGSVKGQCYFTCPEGYGSLLRPDKVRAGDYPEVDEFQFSDGDEI